MKRILSLILCMVLVLSLVPSASLAVDTTRVYCAAPDTWTRCYVYYWGSSGFSDLSWPGVEMERDENGVWFYDVPSEEIKLIFNNGYGSQTADLDLPTDMENMYDFRDHCWKTYTCETYMTEYYVAGVEALCGVAWDPDAPENKMTKVDGLYTKTYADVAAGTYEFKVTDGTWNNAWGDGVYGNYEITVEQDHSTVVITFDPETCLIHTEITGPETLPEEGLISEGTMDFISKTSSLYGISVYFTPVSDGTITIDLLAMDDDCLINVFTDMVHYVEFCSDDAPDTMEFSVQANVQYEVEFSNVRFDDTEPNVCHALPGSISYRITSDVPVNDVARLPHADPGMTLQDAYALEENMRLYYGVTLVGEITEVVTPYDPTYDNITVEMVVPGYESMPVRCFRLSGDGVEDLTIGDTITVTGQLINYYGIVEFEWGCSLDAVIKGDPEVPEPIDDPLELVDAAYALAPGESLPYMSTLTGRIVSIDTPYSDEYRNITVTIVVPGRENKPICCYRLKGDGAEYLAVGDEITVKGVLQHYARYDEYGSLLSSQIEFDAGCKLLNTPEDPQKTTMVYCYTPWERCYVYTWDWTNLQSHSGEWPGTLMTDEGNGLWSYELPAEAESLIFNSGMGSQTYDLTVPTDENILYIVESCEWTDLSWSGPDDNLRSLTVVAPESWGQLYIYTWDPDTYGDFPGKPLEKDGDVYRDVISSKLTYMVISAAEPGGGYYDTDVIELRPGFGGVTVIIDGIKSYSVYYDDYQENTYRVVGNAYFMGNWDCASDAGRMHPIDDGVYQVSFENVPSGHYEFVITINGVWDDCIGCGEYSNFVFDLSEISDVCVTYYEYSGVVDISYDGNNDNFGLDSLALVGTGLPGINEWDPADPAGDMTEITDLVYQKTLAFKAGTTIEFKIVGNDIWDPHWILGGTDLVLNQITDLNSSPYDSNLQLYIERDCQLTFTVDFRPMFDGGYATLLVEEVDSPTPAQRKLTINMPGTWQYVNIYTWDPEAYGAWPGAQVQYNGQSYEMMVDVNMDKLVISGMDSNGLFRQTNDIYLECNGKDVIITVRDDMQYDISYGDKYDFLRGLTVLTPDSWTDAYIYTWEPSYFGDFPGMPMNCDGFYYWELIPADEMNMVISGHGTDGTLRMTDDIHLSVGIRPVTIVIFEDGSYCVTYDEPKPEDDTLRVVGSAYFMGNWDAGSNLGLMEETSLGVSQKYFTNVQPGHYEFMITRNGKWDNAIGNPDGSNLTFEVSEISDVIVICSFDAGDWFVDVQVIPLPIGDVTGDGKLNLGDIASLYSHVRGTKSLIGTDTLRYADFNGDGKVNIGDVAAIYTHVRLTTIPV